MVSLHSSNADGVYFNFSVALATDFIVPFSAVNSNEENVKMWMMKTVKAREIVSRARQVLLDVHNSLFQEVCT